MVELFTDKLDTIAGQVLHKLDNIEAMLQSKALQIVMNLSDEDTMLVKSVLEPSPILEDDCSGTAELDIIRCTLQDPEPEREESPVKQVACDAVNFEAGSPTCLYFEMDKDDDKSE